jgi:hypothetical protein
MSKVVSINEARRTGEVGTSFTAQKLAAVGGALVDQRLTHLDFRLFYYLADATDSQTQTAKRKQRTIAAALGVTTRAVQIGVDRLVEFGHLATETKDGGTYVNAYRIILEKANVGSSFSGWKANPCSPSENKRRTDRTKKANQNVEKGERPFVPTLPFNSHNIPSRARGPSSPDGLGPFGAVISKRIGDAAYRAWFAKAAIAAETPDSVTLSVDSTFRRDHITAQFGPQILDCCRAVRPTVLRVDVVVREAA